MYLVDDERQPVLVTRLTEAKGAELVAGFPDGRYNALARTFCVISGSARQAEPTSSDPSVLSTSCRTTSGGV